MVVLVVLVHSHKIHIHDTHALGSVLDGCGRESMLSIHPGVPVNDYQCCAYYTLLNQN